MASVTLVEAQKLAQNKLIAGLIETIITTDQMFNHLPFAECPGTVTVNRENALGDVQVLGVGDTITAKGAATFTQESFGLTTILGDAEVNGLIVATLGGINDQEAIQVQSKVKSLGRKYRDMFVTGTGSSNQFTGLLSQVAAGQVIAAAGANGDALSFALLDALIEKVRHAKDGKVDFFGFNARTLLSYFALLRSTNINPDDVMTNLPDGTAVPTYRKVPIYVNDWIPTNQTVGATTTATSIICGCWDDGSMKVGVTGLTAPGMGMVVERVGTSHTKDERIIRVKWYAGMAVCNDFSLAVGTGITN
jgi:hypothetical protein